MTPNSSEDTIPTIGLDFDLLATKKHALDLAIDSLVDTAGESWFTLGEALERRRWTDVLDKLESSLVDSEEDAKMTIHIIRKLTGIQEE